MVGRERRFQREKEKRFVNEPQFEHDIHAGNIYVKLHFRAAFTMKQNSISQQSDTLFYKVSVNLPL